MLGIGKVWKTVKTRDAEGSISAPPSTIPRDLANLKVSAPEPFAWDDDAEPNDTRSAERFVPTRATTVLQTSGGRRVSARIINLSRTGVAVEADFGETDVGEVVIVGTRPVTPGRRIARGAVFQFKRPIDPKLCAPSIIL